MEPRIAEGICEREFSEGWSTYSVLNTDSTIAAKPTFSILPSVSDESPIPTLTQSLDLHERSSKLKWLQKDVLLILGFELGNCWSFT